MANSHDISKSTVYGAYPYCTEILYLPTVPQSSGPIDMILPSAERISLGNIQVPGDWYEPDASKNAWFRWVTGHQLSCCLWQALACILGDSELPAQSVENCVILLQTYSLILLYTGSVSPEIYANLLRPFMLMWHASFSGTWAADYRLVKQKLGPVAQKLGVNNRLSLAFRDTYRIHDEVGRVLVGEGTKSLLRQSKQDQVCVSEEPEKSKRFDGFFQIVRTNSNNKTVTGQVASRIKAVAIDLVANGLWTAYSEPRMGDIPFVNSEVPHLLEQLELGANICLACLR